MKREGKICRYDLFKDLRMGRLSQIIMVEPNVITSTLSEEDEVLQRQGEEEWKSRSGRLENFFLLVLKTEQGPIISLGM